MPQKNPINFGSVLWHPSELVERGAFEHHSFSDSEKIIEVSRKYVGVDLKTLGLTPILEEFTKVCELRHGIVHSAKYMAGKNALVLDFPPSQDLIKISIGYGQLQSVASVCTTLVVSYNQKMFATLCERWATSWRNLGVWDPQIEDELFKKIWTTFLSKMDYDNNLIQDKSTWVKCRNLVKAEYNL